MPNSIQSGAKLGRYEIRSKIGEGGMGEVYLADDSGLRRKVALKILPRAVAANKDRMRRFEQEARAAAGLNHPNIAHIYEVGQQDEVNFIAMELIEGETLGEIIQRGQTDLAKLLRYLQHAAEGLAKAHAAGIVHRDLKPENIMVTRDGHAKILDFGLAKLIEQKKPGSLTSEELSSMPTAVIPEHSLPGAVIGTVGYMSPEQAQGRTSEIDHRSDIFSFGCILFEAVTRHRAFAGKDVIDSLNKIIREPAPPISDFNLSAPTELQRIVRRCLAKDADERYQTIKDVAIELKEVRRELTARAESLTTGSLQSPGATAVEGQPTTTAGRSATSEQPVAPPSTRTSSGEYRGRGKLVIALVAAFALLVIAAVIIGPRIYRNATATKDVVDSIAVLPFANSSNDANAAYLSEGITESLINSLSQLPSLRVVSRSAVSRYKDRDVDVQTAGNELKVRSILKGDVKQLGDQLIINVELIDTRDNRQIWGEQYVRKFADVLTVQRDIVEEVSGKLRVKLTNVEQQRIAKRTTNNPEAYRLYLKGRYQATKMTRESFNSSVENLRQAIALDSGYALAYSGLAYYYIATNDQILTPKESMPKAREAAQKALALDDTIVEAHVSLANVYWQYDWDWAKAEAEFKRALELDPANGESHAMFGGFLTFIGRCDEGIAEVNRGSNLNPLSLEADFNLAPGYYFCRRYDEAISSAHNTIALAPDFWLPYLIAGRAYEQKGDLRAAISEYQRARKVDDVAPEPLMDLGRAYGKLGQRAEAERLLNELKARPQQGQYLSPFQLAMVHLGLGDKEQAFAALEQSYEARSWYMTWLRSAPEFDPLRSDERFAAIAKRVGQQ